MLNKLHKQIKIEFISAKLDYEDKFGNRQSKLNNIEIWDMRYLENYI